MPEVYFWSGGPVKNYEKPQRSAFKERVGTRNPLENDSIDCLIIRYSGRSMYLPTRRVGDLLLFPGPELGEQGLDVRGLAHDRGDG